MPAPFATSADRRDLFDNGTVLRTCTRCGTELPLTPENFQHRNNWIDARCQDCRRAVDAERRQQRREGNGVRTGRQFGIEIEFIGSRHAVERAMREAGLACEVESYNHRVRPHWKVTTDASVAGGGELVSPPLRGANGREQVKKACRALVAAGATINGSCGLHVHHDCNDLNGAALSRLARNWSSQQRLTDNLVARSRRNGNWCYPLSPTEVTRLQALPATQTGRELQRSVDGVYLDRYRSINFQVFSRYGTIEIRQHQGTMNAKKILAWVAYGQAFIRASKQTELAAHSSTDALLDTLAQHGMGAPTVTYLKARAAQFQGNRARVAA